MDAGEIVDELRHTHISLLQKVDFDAEASDQLLEEIEDLVVRLRLGGRQIEAEDQRNALNEYLRVWGGYLYNQRGSQCPFAEIMPYTRDRMGPLPSDSPSSTISDAGGAVPPRLTTYGPMHLGTGDIRIGCLQLVLQNPRLPKIARSMIEEEIAAMQQAPENMCFSSIFLDLGNLLHDQIVQPQGLSAFRMELKAYGFSPEEVSAIEQITLGVGSQFCRTDTNSDIKE